MTLTNPLNLTQLRKASKRIKEPLKIMGYAFLGIIVMTGVSWATLDTQVDKATNLVLGKVAALIVGGGTLFGGGHALIQGNIGKGMAILGTGGLTGIGIALAKDQLLFSLLK